MSKRTGIGLGGLLALIVLVTLLGPAEKTLGATARIIYIHGALVWVAIMVFCAAALLGTAGLLARRTGGADLLGWIPAPQYVGRPGVLGPHLSGRPQLSESVPHPRYVTHRPGNCLDLSPTDMDR